MEIKKNQPIGIFDSGIGGVSCLGQGINMLPREKFIYFGDSGVDPYALLSPLKVKAHCFEACEFLAQKSVKAIVIACNTATGIALVDLRKKYDIPILGMEPALKVATDLGLNGKIVVMATGMTLKSKMVENLIQKFGQGFNIVKMRCRDLINLVESGIVDGAEVEQAINACFDKFDLETIAAVVFGCTHLGFLEKSFQKIIGDRIHIADGNQGTIRHLINILDRKKLLTGHKKDTPAVEIYNSGGEDFIKNSKIILHKHLSYLSRNLS